MSVHQLLQGFGPDILKAGAKQLLSKATPYLANILTSGATKLGKRGINVERLLDSSLNFLHNNQLDVQKIGSSAMQRYMNRPRGPNAMYGDTTRNGFETPESSIFRNTNKRMPVSLMMPDSTPYVVGDEGITHNRRQKQHKSFDQYESSMLKNAITEVPKKLFIDPQLLSNASPYPTEAFEKPTTPADFLNKQVKKQKKEIIRKKVADRLQSLSPQQQKLFKEEKPKKIRGAGVGIPKEFRKKPKVRSVGGKDVVYKVEI